MGYFYFIFWTFTSLLSKFLITYLDNKNKIELLFPNFKLEHFYPKILKVDNNMLRLDFDLTFQV